MPVPARPSSAEAQVVRSEQPRQTAPAVSDAAIQQLVDGNTAFAFRMYHQMQQRNGNIFFSPWSISEALAMVDSGAQGSTAAEIAQTLHFTLPPEQLHPAFNAVALRLARYDAAQGSDEPRFQLSIANALWGQTGYPFRQPFLDTLAENYGAGMHVQNFKAEPEQARAAINAWVSDQTANKINNLLPQGSVNMATRLVLTNAIYFNAKWQSPFRASSTSDGTFTLLDGSTISVPMMQQAHSFRYAAGDTYEAIELPYAVPGNEGGMSMLILLPKAGQFQSFEQALDEAQLNAIMSSLKPNHLELTMPKWTFTSQSVSLKQVLTTLGMKDAFDANTADFGGMTDTAQTDEKISISDVFHKAFVAVDEEGTEAAAATGAVMGATSAAPPKTQMIIDHPFIFLIRDQATGSVLFLGRTTDPRG
ncbi:MAG TPA: serpin family protein [Roseiflexaceae bacterium]|nr:serpin family protein [Roseiflexaceae bacterium]